jgi:ubiquitin carboxyl-terminal hydrolase 25/28
MKNKDAPKPRRRLTIPNILRVKWPNTSVAGTSPVASTSFYPGTQAPPLPMRPINVTQGYDSQSAADGRSASDAKDYQSPVYSANNVIIDGRNLDEEASWWDASVREINNRPGPGILPPVLADELHDPNHSLFSVSVTSPNLYVPLPSSSAPTHTPSSSQRPPPPTDDEVRTAIPHPNAYYCPKENGWVLLSWKSSSVPPPLARSFLSTAHHPLPDQNRRKRTGSCIGDVGQPFGQTNKTHHFHKYAKAVDAHKLTPPFRRDDWETLENVKAKRRAESIIMEVIDLEKMKAQEGDEMQEDEAGEEGKLLDLYVCCQCSFYCVASGVISGVIPCKFLEEFVRDRKSSPQPGKTGELAVVLALETLILCV